MINVETARLIAEEHGLNWVVLFGYIEGKNCLCEATYGVRPIDKMVAAQAGELIAPAIGAKLKEGANVEDFRNDLDAARYRRLIELARKYMSPAGMSDADARDFEEICGRC